MNIENTLWDEKKAAQYCNLAVKTLQTWRQRGGGPVYVKLSRKCVRYRKADLDAWAEARLTTSTSAGVGK